MRAYLGDSLFFEGLKSITNNYKFKTINSSQFRDELNTSTSVDMTNFFNDWVFSPGFSHFDIDSVAIVANGPNFDIDVHVQQKLRGATNYHTGTPLEITFYDNNWNKHVTKIVASGQYSTSNVTIPFSPTVYILNEANKLNQARTDERLVVTSTFSNNQLSLGMFDALSVSSVPDSALLQIEHHWVAPDSIKNNINNYRISTSRYWSVDGIIPSSFSSTMKLRYDGASGNGFLDQDLVPVNGDSIILLYRRSPKDDWIEYKHYTKTYLGPSVAIGFVTIDSLSLGEYTFANGESTIGIKEELITNNDFKIFPNPSDSHIWIESTNSSSTKVNDVQVYDLNGKIIHKGVLRKKTKIDTKKWPSGTYIVTIKNVHNSLHINKFVKK